jgi:RHS repeat-associated protein
MLNRLNILTVFLILQIFSVQAETLHTVPAGGNWDDPATWVEARVPVETDDVEINGHVYLNSDTTISGLVINSDSILERVFLPGEKTLTINGNVLNNGTIQNHNAYTGTYHYYILTLNIDGNLTNNGVWRNYQLNLTAPDSVIIDGTATIESSKINFSAQNLEITQTNFPGDVEFQHANVNLTIPDNTITFGKNVTGQNVTVTGTSALTLNFTGSSTISATFDGNISQLNFSGDNQNLPGTFNATDEIILSGNNQTFSGTFTAAQITIAGTGKKSITTDTTINGNLIIEETAILERTSSSGEKTLTINGNVLNNGTIQNHNAYTGTYHYYTLTLNLTGNLTNNGIWRNYQLNLTAPDSVIIDGTATIESSQINFSAQNLEITQTNFPSDVEFQHANVNLTVPDNTITFGKNVTGQNVTITGTSALTLNFTGSSTISATFDGNISQLNFSGDNQNLPGTFNATDEIILSGNNQTFSGTFTAAQITIASTGKKSITTDTTINGNLIIEETAILERTSSYGEKNLTINGNVLNNGTIQNHNAYIGTSTYHILTLNLTGNLTNNGVWRNYHTNVTWLPIENAQHYEFRITDGEWNDPIIVTNTEYEISNYIHNPELQDTNYDWQVRAIVNETPTDWSETKHIIQHYHVAWKIHPTTYAFGIIDAGNQSPPQAFTLSNTGNLDLIINTIELTGADATEFNISDEDCQTITPTNHCTINIVFAPTTTGGKTAILSITSNAPQPLEIILTGGGIPGTATLIAPSGIINTNQPTFTWHAVENVTLYRLNLNDTTTLEYTPSELACPDGTGTCSIILDTPLPEGNAYWKVQTANDTGDGFWSATLNFQVETLAGTLQFSAASFNVNENETSITLSVERTNGRVGAISVDYTTTDDTATAGSDYIATSGTLNWAHNETDSKTFTVTLINDSIVEGDETFTTSLSNITGGAILGARNTATITLTENDLTGPEISNIQYQGTPLLDGATLTQSGTLSLTATDSANIGHVDFLIDNSFYQRDTNGSTQYTAYLSLTEIEDGTHTLTIKAYDSLGNLTSTSLEINVALAPPAAPTITQPLNGTITNQAQITVKGTAEKGSQVLLYRDNTQIGEPLTLDNQNRFTGTLALEEGQNNLQAAAQNRGGLSSLSNTITVTLDSSIPNPPNGLTAYARENGQVRLIWQAQPNINGYDIYRATSSFTSTSQAQKINAELITGTQFNDLVPSEAQYYYRVLSINNAGTESALSNEVSVWADLTPPRATLIEYTPQGTLTQGRVNLTITVSEPLLTTPFLSIVPDGGIPIPVELTLVTETQYQGHFEITDSTKSGTAYAVFSARDLAGNRGTEIDAGATLQIDSDGPFVTQLTLTPNEPIRNDPPATLQVEITLNEAPATTPALFYVLSGAEPVAITLTQQSALIWTAQFTLPETENLLFLFQAEDDLGNVGTEIQDKKEFQIYQGDLPPLPVPQNLTATALPGGQIHLTWETVEGAAEYQLYRQAPGETELTAYQRHATNELTETTSEDGLYHYAVASVRQANAQEALSAYSNIVQVTADSIAPEAPTNLQLELIGAGIQATWQKPLGETELTYNLYRSTTETLGSPLKTDITELKATDNAPSEDAHYYAVTAVDAAGNESTASDFAYLNFELLSVATLEVVQDSDNLPIITWSHPTSTEFDLYIDSLKINTLSDTQYTDAGYLPLTERSYSLVARDSQGAESPERTVILPALSIELQTEAPLQRGQFNTLLYQVRNHAAQSVTNIKIQAELGNHTVQSETFALLGFEQRNIEIVIGGYADLADLSPLVTTLEVSPETGEVARFIRHSELDVIEGSSLRVSLQTKDFTRGSDGQIKFNIENTGAVDIEIATDEIGFLLLDEDENVLTVQDFKQTLGRGIVTLSNGQTVARIPAGGYFESEWLAMPVPASAPSSVKLQLNIEQIHYHLGEADTVSLEGFSRIQSLSLVDTSYFGELISVNPETSYGDEPVVITGRAVARSTGQVLSLVPLKLVISLRGFERTYEVYTDKTGVFSYTFNPLEAESGLYKVSILHPALTERAEQGEFLIQRLDLGRGATEYQVDLRIPFNYEKSIWVPVAAGAESEGHNIRLVYEATDQPLGELPTGVTVTLGNALPILEAGSEAQLNFSVKADNSAEPTGNLVLKVLSDEVVLGTVLVNYQFSDAAPALFYSPSFIETGVGLDNTVTETLRLENQGLAALNSLHIELLETDGSPAPEWIFLTTQNLGTLAVGDSREVQIMASPSTGEGVFEFLVRASSDNHATTDIPVFVTVTQSGIGSVLFKLEDIYTATLDTEGNVIQGLAGAKIRVQNDPAFTVDETLITDENGEALFDNLPAGGYKFKASAPNHQDVTGRFQVKPGITVSKRVFLDYNLITIEWSVTEIPLEDRYEINLDATYETQVPAPVVLWEPLTVNLPSMAPGEVFSGELGLTNHGLIRAYNLNFYLPNDQYFKYEWLTALPESLEAGERVVIPYRVTALSSVGPEGSESGGGCRGYSNAATVGLNYVCANGDEQEDSASTHFVYVGGGGFCGYGRLPFQWPGGVYGLFGYSSLMGILAESSISSARFSLDKDCIPLPEREECSLETADGLIPVGSSINLRQRDFYESVTDLFVKVPGGTVSVRREFFENKWNFVGFEPLVFEIDDETGEVSSIKRDDVVYEFAGGEVFVHKQYQIVPSEAGFEWRNKKGDWELYDIEGRLLSFGDRKGTIASLVYSGELVTGVTGGNGQVLWLEYADGFLRTVRDSAGREVVYDYVDERLNSVTDVLGGVTQYVYDEEGYLVEKVNPAGNSTVIEYDDKGFAAGSSLGSASSSFDYEYDESLKRYYGSVVGASGKKKEVWFDEDGKTKRVDVNGKMVKLFSREGSHLLIKDTERDITRRYDEWENLIEVTYSDESSVSFEYDPVFHKVSKVTDRRGFVTTYSYDGVGNLLERREAVDTEAEKKTDLVYDDEHRLISMTFEGDAETEETTTTWTYDSNDNVTSVTDSEGGVVEYLSYDAMGNPLELRDKRGFVWRFAYDAQGNLVSITDPLDQVSSFEYDSVGNVTALVDAALHRTELAYDEHNQVVQTVDALGNVSEIVYNSDQLPIEVIDALGRRVFGEYDVAGRLVREVDGAGNETVSVFDEGNLNLPMETEFPSFSQQFDYDQLQRLVRQTSVLPARNESEEDRLYSVEFEYDVAGNVVSQTDEEGKVTRFEYDALNRLVKTIDALDGVTEFGYDRRGNLVSVTDANGGVTRFEFDGNDNVVKEIRPEGQETRYEYDAAGNLTARFDAKGQKIAYLYDALSRLVQVDYFDSSDALVKTVTFSYDAVGNLLSYSDGTTSASYSYDAVGQKLSESVDYGSFSLSQGYEYFANGLKKSFTGADGVRISYAYDENNRLTSVEIPDGGLVTVNGFEWNSPAKVTLPGGSEIELGYDQLMRLESKVVKEPAESVVLDYGYEYSPTSNITSKSTEHGDYSYEYDELYRLTGAASPVLEDESYLYDLLGNRLNDGATFDGNNALLSDDEAVFEYDANGNLVKKTVGTQITHYIYNVEDRLVRVEDGSGVVVAEYYYDPFGRRLFKDVGGVRTYFVYSDEGLVGEFDESGVELKGYGYRPNSIWTTNPLFLKVAGEYFWYLNDHLGTPQKIVDSQGIVVWEAVYETFGKARVDVEVVESNLRLAGQYFDVESGLHYNWHRYYEPGLGRYFRVDPVWALNLYAYVLGQPIRLIDPLGLTYWDGFTNGFIGFIAGSVVGAAVVATAPAWLAGGLAVAAAGVGGFFTGVNIYEAVTGQDYWTRTDLSSDERETRVGQLAFDALAFGLGCTWFNKTGGAKNDWEWLSMSPSERWRYDQGMTTTSKDKFELMEKIAPEQRDLGIFDTAPSQYHNTIGTGASPAGRFIWPFGLTGGNVLEVMPIIQ